MKLLRFCLVSMLAQTIGRREYCGMRSPNWSIRVCPPRWWIISTSLTALRKKEVVGANNGLMMLFVKSEQRSTTMIRRYIVSLEIFAVYEAVAFDAVGRVRLGGASTHPSCTGKSTFQRSAMPACLFHKVNHFWRFVCCHQPDIEFKHLIHNEVWKSI